MFDKSRGGDETRHKYLTHSEWHTDSKFVGLLKVGYQTSILEIKFKKAHTTLDELWMSRTLASGRQNRTRFLFLRDAVDLVFDELVDL